MSPAASAPTIWAPNNSRAFVSRIIPTIPWSWPRDRLAEDGSECGARPCLVGRMGIRPACNLFDADHTLMLGRV
jgi:hypothetical protein